MAFSDEYAPILPGISDREQQLLQLAAHGHTDSEIAQLLAISHATVSMYWTRLRTKLHAKSRTEAVAVALRHRAEMEQRKLEARYRESLRATPDKSGWSSSLQDLVSKAPDGIFVTDRFGLISLCNTAFAAMFGYEQGQLEGTHLCQLVPDRYREAHLGHVGQFEPTSVRHRMGHGLCVPGLKKEGTEFPVCITLSGCDLGGIRCVVGMARDYTSDLAMLKALDPGFRLDCWTESSSA